MKERTNEWANKQTKEQEYIHKWIATCIEAIEAVEDDFFTGN